MAKTYEFSEDLQILTEKVVKDLGEEFKYVDISKILFVNCKGVKKGKFVAQIHKIHGPYVLLAGGHEFFLESNDTRFSPLSPEGKAKVVEHELRHISKKDSCRLIDHNIKDFAEQIDKYGMDYCK
jgi:predicted metallopeptidase